MIISNDEELQGMQQISTVVAVVLRKMRESVKPGITTKQLDDYGGEILRSYGAVSAPVKAYRYPGHTCISVNHVAAHGIPSNHVVIQEGDLVNIDVSAELNGFWSDNGGSFIVGHDTYNHSALVEASKVILKNAIDILCDGIRIADLGSVIEQEARNRGFRVIRNLAGHGVGRSLHEDPDNILNYKSLFNRKKFVKDSVVAIETFISTKSDNVVELDDGWSLVGDKGGFVAQHEHTVVVTSGKPLILTLQNGIWD